MRKIPVLFALAAALTGCTGGGSISPAPTVAATGGPALPASAYTTASCNTSGTTSASITGGNIVGFTNLTTPADGGCSYTSNLGTVVLTGPSAGTYTGSISLTAPAGLPSIPTTNVPPGFSVANFVPLFYVTFQLSGFLGNISPDNPAITVTVNSITTSSNSLNFFIGNWSANVPGSTPPALSATAFTGWSNNDSLNAPDTVPLTVKPPNTLSLPAFPCAPSVNCAPNAYTAPLSFTLVQVVGYFT